MALQEINPHLEELDVDVLYHLGLTSEDDLPGLFGDTKFVCMGGSGERAEKFATKISQQLGLPIERYCKEPSEGQEEKEDKVESTSDILTAVDKVIGGELNLRETMRKINNFVATEAGLPTPIGKTERFELYKVGSIIVVSHGMGEPSMQIELDEVTKVLHYAGAEDFEYFRIGTSGGVGVPAGGVVIADEAMNDSLEPIHKKTEIGKEKEYQTQLNTQLAQDLLAAAGDINAQIGKTMGTDDFYLGQGRMDGFFDPGYTLEEHFEFLDKAHEAGVRNIEMEATAFAAFCLRAGIPATIICCALLDRLEGDQVTSTPEELASFSDNAEQVVINYIRSRLIEDSITPAH
jgi:uridine phosphorylase